MLIICNTANTNYRRNVGSKAEVMVHRRSPNLGARKLIVRKLPPIEIWLESSSRNNKLTHTYFKRTSRSIN